MGSPESSTPRRHHGAIVAAAVGVAVVVTGASALSLSGSEPEAAPASAPASAPEDPTVDLDTGPVSDEDVEACAAGGFAPDAGSVEVLYGVRQQSAQGDLPVLLLRNAAGELRFCDVAGTDAPAQLPLPEVSPAEPVVFLTNGRKTWDCTDAALDRYSSTTWLAVGPDVAAVQERYWQGREAGPWFTTQARGGYAHLQTWVDGPLAKQARLRVQTRVLDTAGDPIAQPALVPGRQPLAGCTDGDVQIG